MRVLFLDFFIVSAYIQTAFTTACSSDEECSEDNCCSAFGFCGYGEGFCTPSSRSNLKNKTKEKQRKTEEQRNTTSSKSGAGCVLENVEWVGGDLPSIVGGGGIRLDKNTSEECFSRCDDNPGCKWYTYDDKEKLCYLKSGRGYMRDRKDGFTSGATFRDGCNEDPRCDSPYRTYRHQCFFFSSEYHPWSPSLADVRRNLNRTKELCEEFGGFLPYDFAGYSGGPAIGDAWHWVNYGSAEHGECWAGRPGRWTDGVRAFPCSASLPFACQRRRAFPLPAQHRPQVYVVTARRYPGRRRRPGNRASPRVVQRGIFGNRIRGSSRANPFLYF